MTSITPDEEDAWPTPTDDVAALYEELEEREERLALRQAQLRRARQYFAWKLPVLAGVWYLTMLVDLPRWAMLAFVVALTIDYALAATRVRTAERERDELAALIARGGLIEGD